MVECKEDEDLINMTDVERMSYSAKRYAKLYLVIAKRIRTSKEKPFYKNRVREIQKYLDLTIPHLDMIAAMKVYQLQPETVAL